MSGVSQPTLSAQVRDLERIVAVSPFHRQGRQIRLTPAGERLFQPTTRLSAAIDEVEQALTFPRSEARSLLRVLSLDERSHRYRDAVNPNHASAPATTQAIQLAQTGIAVPSRETDHPIAARAS